MKAARDLNDEQYATLRRIATNQSNAPFANRVSCIMRTTGLERRGLIEKRGAPRNRYYVATERGSLYLVANESRISK